MKLTFTYHPFHDGAAVDIGDVEHLVHIFAWDVTDTLSDLIRCLVQLLEGYDHVWCHWEDDPGGHKWVFTRDGDDVHIKILRFSSSNVGYGAPNEWAETFFETTCPLLKFAAKVRNEARRLLHDLGSDAYQRLTGHPFPFSEYEMLRQLIRERHVQ